MTVAKKDEAHWTRWIEEHDTDAMIYEVIDLGNSIFNGKGTLSDEQIVVRGQRQAYLVHELLEFYGGHPDDVADLANELDQSVDRLMQTNAMYLATHGGEVKNPAWN